MEDHKISQRFCILDKEPIVETNIGFINFFNDPLKTKGEFLGFVTIRDKTKSLILEELVKNA